MPSSPHRTVEVGNVWWGGRTSKGEYPWSQDDITIASSENSVKCLGFIVFINTKSIFGK